MSEDEARIGRAFNCLIAEYNSLRGEVLARIGTQNQCFNFLLIITGAAITAVISTVNAGKEEYLPSVIISVALLLPLVTCPLGYMFFDNVVMIHAIGSHLYHSLYKRMKDLTSDP